MNKKVMRPLTEAEMQTSGSGLVPCFSSMADVSASPRQVNVPKLVIFV